jgi:hypothetical protein
VDPLAEHPHGFHGQPGLLKDFPDRGGFRALARLDLAAGQDPRRRAVVRAAAHQQQAAVLDDDRDGYSLATRIRHASVGLLPSLAASWAAGKKRVTSRKRA